MFKLIIGGGITGLLAAYYNEDYLLVSKDIGGQMKKGDIGPRILEVNENSKKLLKEFGIKENVKKATIGYEVCGSLVENFDKSDRVKYYMKSRCVNNPIEVPDSVMSDGKNEIIYYDLSWGKLIQKIRNKIKNRIINDNVQRIDIKKKLIYLENNPIPLPYYDLTSTIPAPLFYQLCGIENNKFKYVNKHFIITSQEVFDIKDYDYVYFTSDRYKFHRITKLKKKKYSIEFTTNDGIDLDLLEENDSYIFMKYGQLVSGQVDKFDNIRFLGRFAEWNHGIKVDDIVGKLTNNF